MSSADEIRAKRAALAAARAARALASSAEAEIEAEKQGLVDDEALEAIEVEHGTSYVHGEQEPGRCKVAVVRTPFGAAILSRAVPVVWKRFIQSGKTGEKELYDLVSPSLLHPTKARFAEICDDQPMTLTTCASAVAEMAGARTNEVQKKA
jgi:hypothetical protein